MSAEEEALTPRRLERELEEAQKKLEETEKLIEAVERELAPWEEEYESGGNCCEDFDDEERKERG
ncbi:hypothetical protein [Hydrogenimonas sp.]